MGYECPVCGAPQADARHLANHLAFTAVLGREDHEAWLDEHAPGWSEAGEAELAPRVAEHATEREFPQVFEDTAGGLEESEDPDDPPEERSGALFDEIPEAHDHGGGHQHAPREAHLAGAGVDAEEMDPETRAAIEEAREMTEAMLGADEDDGDAETDDDVTDADGSDADEAGEGDRDNNA